MYRKLFVISILVLSLTSNTSAADVFKIAVIDFKEFMDRSSMGKAVQKQIQDKGEEIKSELEKIQAELKASQERYQQEAPLWTQEKKSEEERSFRIRINNFNKIKLEKEKEFAAFSGNKINEVKVNIIEYAEKKGKDEGYSLIFEKQTGSILYANGSINITNEVIQDINKNSKK